MLVYIKICAQEVCGWKGCKKMRLLKIGIDFDGVVVNQIVLFQQAAKIQFSEDIAPEDCCYRKFLRNRPPEDMQKIISIYCSSLLLGYYQEVLGAIEFIKKLQSSGHVLAFPTARRNEAICHAKNYLERNGVCAKRLIGFSEDKSKVLDGFHILIDDSVDHLEQVKDLMPHRILFKWPYNRDEWNHPAVTDTVDSWPKLYQKICAIASS